MLFLVAVFAILVALTCLHAFRVTPFIVTVLTLLMTWWGFHALATRTSTTVEYGLGVLALVIGYLALGGHRHPARDEDPAASCSPERRSLALAAATVVCAVLTAYHFSRIGIPLLSANVETQRFNFDSGLFGLPARVYLFGLPLLTLVALREYEAGRVGRRLVWCVLLLLIGSRLASGFKSGILEVITILLFAKSTSAGGLTIGASARRYLVPLALATMFASFVFQLYGTSAATQQSPVDALAKRVTVGTAQPGVLAVESGRQILPGSSVLGNDLSYTLGKYAHIGAHPAPFAYSQLVSSRLYQTPLSGDSFIVPVTVGEWPALMHDLAVPLALGAMMLLGAAFALLQRMTVRTVGWLRHLAGSAGLLILNASLTKGDLVYTVFNVTAMAVFLAAVLGFATAVRDARRTQPYEVLPALHDGVALPAASLPTGAL